MQFHLFSSRYIWFLRSCRFKRIKIRNNRNIEFLDTEQRQITINKASPAQKKIDWSQIYQLCVIPKFPSERRQNKIQIFLIFHALYPRTFPSLSTAEENSCRIVAREIPSWNAYRSFFSIAGTFRIARSFSSRGDKATRRLSFPQPS